MVKGRETETQRFLELFPNHSIFVIQGLPGTGKKTFIESLIPQLSWSGKLTKISIETSFEEALKGRLGQCEGARSLEEEISKSEKELFILEDLHKATDFQNASIYLAGMKRNPVWKWIVITDRALTIPKLDRLDLCTFTLKGLSTEDARRWILEIQKKNNLPLKEDLQKLIDLSGGHPLFMKLILAHLPNSPVENWTLLRSNQEFRVFESSIREKLSKNEIEALEEIARYCHGIPIEALRETKITNHLLDTLEDHLLIEQNTRIRFSFPFLSSFFKSPPTRRTTSRLFSFYQRRCNIELSSIEDLYGLGFYALQSERLQIAKEVIERFTSRIHQSLHAQWALELLKGLEETGEKLTPKMKLLQIDCLNLLAKYDEGDQKISDLERSIPTSLDTESQNHLRRSRMWSYLMDGKYQRAVDEIRETLTNTSSLPVLDHINDLNHLAFNYVFLGRFGEAKAAAEESLSLQATIPEGVSCFSNSFLIVAFDVIGDYHKALALAEKFLEDANRNRDRLYQALIYRFMAKTLTELGQYGRAEERIEHALSTFVENENPYAKYSVLSLAGRIHGLQGKYNLARTVNEECCQYLSLFPNQFAYLVAKFYLATLETDQGRLETAKEILLAVRETAFKTDCRPIYARAVAKLGEIELLQGKPYEAYKRIESAKEINEGVDDPLLKQILLGMESKLAVFQRDETKAIKLLEQAEDIARSFNTPYQRALTQNRLAELFFRKGDFETSKNYLQQSYATHDQLGDLRGKTDDLSLFVRFALYEKQFSVASEYEQRRFQIIQGEGYPRLLASSFLVQAIICWKQNNLQSALTLCEGIKEEAQLWERMAAWKFIRMISSDSSKLEEAAKQIEMLDAILSPFDRRMLDQFFIDYRIEPPKEFSVKTAGEHRLHTFEQLSQLNRSQFDLWVDFSNNHFYERQLGSIDLGLGTLIRLVFETLIFSAGTPFSKEQLFLQVWKGEYHPLAHDPKIYFMINRLRRLIEPTSSYRYILSSENGYLFNPDIPFCAIKRVKPDQMHPLNPRQITLLKLLLSIPYLNNQEYRKRFQVSNATAFRDLKELSDRGLVVREGSGRGARYRAKET